MTVEIIILKLGTQLLSSLMTEAQFAADFRSQFQTLRTNLDMIKAFLADTDNLRTKKETLKTSLIKLRELVYEADDIMTDCIIRDQYQNEVTCPRFNPNEWLFSSQLSRRLKALNSRMEKMGSNLNQYLTPQLSLLSSGEPTYSARVYTSQDFDPSEIIGLETDLEKLKGWIFGTGEAHHKIGIVGMGGLGKTTIAQKVFSDKEVAGSFRKRIWVSVSQDLNEDRIIRSIMEQLGQSATGVDLGQMLHKISKSLAGQDTLIVMDDIWNFNQEWWVKLCSAVQKQSKKSCFIITTRNEDTAARMGVENPRMHRPKVLNEQDSWLLFSNFAFSATKGVCPNLQFERVGKDIVAKCGGLPLAIKTIAALLAPKAHNLGEWKEIYDNFHELTTRQQSSSVKASLQLSYDALPIHLKQFLLCFSIYPEDFVIPAEQLVNWWVGEGFILGTDYSKTANELGYGHLMELVRRCLVEVVERRGYDGRVYSCKMHDLVRDLTTMIAEEEMFCSFEAGKQKLTPDSRWVGITSEMSSAPLRRCPKLRALLLMSSSQGQAVPFNRNHMVWLGSLRVLDLSNVRLDGTSMENLLRWICSLPRLAYLNLSGAQGLRELPPLIRRLRNLHLLILAGCSHLTKLHPSVTSLKKLLVLDLGSCGLEYLPQGIGNLSQLQELSGFRVVSQGSIQSCRLIELEKLVQLRVLRMSIGDDSEITEAEREVLSKLPKLKVLSINTEDCKETKILELLDGLSPPPSLQELYLRRYRNDTLPKWINPADLSGLRYLCIENGDVSYINPSRHSDEGSTFSWNFLEGLCLKFLPNLEEDWNDLKETMQSIRYIEISSCYKLKNFPCSVDKPGIWRKVED